jgi:hypothetical protein
MTLQIPDILRLRDQEYAVTAVDGSGLFDPQACGLQAGRLLSTGCWRGYICTYEITAQLLLREVERSRGQGREGKVERARSRGR